MRSIKQLIHDADHYLENAQYMVHGTKQLNARETILLREQVNRAKNTLQALKERYEKDQK